MQIHCVVLFCACVLYIAILDLFIICQFDCRFRKKISHELGFCSFFFSLSLTEGDIGVCSIVVLVFFSYSISVILTCGTAVSSSPALCVFF